MKITEQFISPYSPTPLQLEVHNAQERFVVAVWHRGAGKSWVAAAELIRRAWACTETLGAVFMYVAPEKAQAKKLIWDKLKYFLQKRIVKEDGSYDYVPIEGIHFREDELTITFPDNNAVIRLEGADMPDRLRGLHPHYLVLDEVGNMKRDLWYSVCLPGIQANNASVLFIGTPMGDNLFKELYDFASDSGNPEWKAMLRNVYQTGLLTEKEITMRKAFMPQAEFEQEYLCSWDSKFTGSYYSEVLDRDNGIIDEVPYNPMYPVITAWDLGVADPTAVWFVQQIDGKIHIIDYYENSNPNITYHISQVKSKPYIYKYHIIPHDGTKRSWEAGKSRVDIMNRLGLRTEMCPKISPQEGISLATTHLSICKFDKVKCALGINQLRAYRAKTDKLTGKPLNEPKHDGASHGADAFRYLIVGLKKPRNESMYAGKAQWYSDQFGESLNGNTVVDYNFYSFDRGN